MTITVGRTAEVEAWLAAESRIKKQQQPEGSITSTQYAEMMGCSESSARRRLRALYKAGEATRTHFHPGDQRGASWAYTRLKVKK